MPPLARTYTYTHTHTQPSTPQSDLVIFFHLEINTHTMLPRSHSTHPCAFSHCLGTPVLLFSFPTFFLFFSFLKLDTIDEALEELKSTHTYTHTQAGMFFYLLICSTLPIASTPRTPRGTFVAVCVCVCVSACMYMRWPSHKNPLAPKHTHTHTHTHMCSPRKRKRRR